MVARGVCVCIVCACRCVVPCVPLIASLSWQLTRARVVLALLRRFVFCAVDGVYVNRSMPMSSEDVQVMSRDFLAHGGTEAKGTRSWRRLLANAPMAGALAAGDFAAIPGRHVAVARLGGLGAAGYITQHSWGHQCFHCHGQLCCAPACWQ